jgi:hypothetical protein
MPSSPAGHTLYAATGAMSESKIRDVLCRYMRDWDSWSRTGEHFDGMMDQAFWRDTEGGAAIRTALETGGSPDLSLVALFRYLPVFT